MNKLALLLITLMMICVVCFSGCNENMESDNDNIEFDIDLVEFNADIISLGRWIVIGFSYDSNQQTDSIIELKKVSYNLYGNNMLLKSNDVEYVDINSAYVAYKNSGMNDSDIKKIEPNIIPNDKNLSLSKDFIDLFNIGNYSWANKTIYNWKIDFNQDLKDAINSQLRGENVTIEWKISGDFSFLVDGEYYSLEFLYSTIKTEYL
jgi:hypothetical protein